MESISWSRTWATRKRQRAGNLWDAARRICVENECILLLRADQRLKTKPRRRTPACSSARSVPVCERSWTDIEPETYSNIAYPVSKQVSALRHGHLPREDDGAIEFLEIKRSSSERFSVLSALVWCMEESNGKRVRKTRQDFHTVMIHQDKNTGLISERQSLRKRQTVFHTSVDHLNKEHKHPDTIDLGAPRLAQYMHKAWKKHQNTVCWSTWNLLKRKDFQLHQTRSNAIILYGHTSSLLFSASCYDGNWRIHLRESTCVTSTSSKDFL